MLVFWPFLGLVFHCFTCLFGSITCRMFRLCGESLNYRRLVLFNFAQAYSHVIARSDTIHGTIGSLSRFAGQPEEPIGARI